MNFLQKQLETEYKQDAEDCIEIYNKLKEMDNGSVCSSKWSPLVHTIYKGFPSDNRRFQPTAIGRIFLKGLRNN
jgi:hypothetical protein